MLRTTCADCEKAYPFGYDVTVPNDLWEKIAPYDGNGLLCPNCIVARIEGLALPITALRMTPEYSASEPKAPDSDRITVEMTREQAVKLIEAAAEKASSLRREVKLYGAMRLPGQAAQRHLDANESAVSAIRKALEDHDAK